MTGQMLMSGFEGTTLNFGNRGPDPQPHVGGLILFSRNYENPQQLHTLIRDLQEVAASTSTGLPLFISVDQEGVAGGTIDRTLHQIPPIMLPG